MTPQQHEKWLRKMGVHPDQLKEKKPKKKKVYRPKTVASGYYEDKKLSGSSPLLRGQEKKLNNPSLQIKVLEENRTSPRDLGGDRDYTWER